MADAVVLDSRFWEKTRVDEATPLVNGCHCRVWTAKVDNNGRGRVFGRYWYQGKMQIAYLLSCAAAEGRSLEEMKELELKALHACDHPLCVEPAHLRSGTQSENMKEMVAKNRGGGFLRDRSLAYVRTAAAAPEAV